MALRFGDSNWLTDRPIPVAGEAWIDRIFP